MEAHVVPLPWRDADEAARARDDVTPATVNQALAKAHAASSFGDRMFFRTDRALALRL